MRRSAQRYFLGLILVLAAAGSAWAQDPSPPFPTPEEVADRGFAVWPEDTLEEGQQACAQRTEADSWRLSPEGVAERFAAQMMNHPDPQSEPELSEVEATSARIWIHPPNELATIFTVEKFGDCWFITFIEHREFADVAFTYSNDGAATTAHLGPGFGLLELGFGGEQRQKPHGERAVLHWTLGEEAASSGHYSEVYFRDNGVGTLALADALPPPPQPQAGTQVYPAADGPIWDDVRAEGDAVRCRYQPYSAREPERVVNNLLAWQFYAAMPSGPYPDVLHKGEDGPIGKRVERYRKSNRRWVLIVDDVRYEVRLAKVMERCWAIQRLEAPALDDVLSRAWVNGDQATVETHEQWGNAGVGLLYGSEGVALMSRPTLGVAMTDADIGSYSDNDFDRDSPGVIDTFLLKKGRYVNAQLVRLPPIE